MDEGRRVISSRDILGVEFYEIDRAIINLMPYVQTDNRYRYGIANLIIQLRRIMDFNILELTNEEQEKFRIPQVDMVSVEDIYNNWMPLHTNLTNLARKIGVIARDMAPWGDSLMEMFKAKALEEIKNEVHRERMQANPPLPKDRS